MVKNREINGTEEIALVTPTPGRLTIHVDFRFSNTLTCRGIMCVGGHGHQWLK